MPPTPSSAPAGALRLTYKELGQHVNLIGIEDVLYDVQAFAPVHPGGKLIRACGGKYGGASNIGTPESLVC